MTPLGYCIRPLVHPVIAGAQATYDEVKEICGSPNMTDHQDLKRCWTAFWVPSHTDTADFTQYNSRFIWEKYPQLYDKGLKDEHFITWMRTAGLPTFRKLYGKIEPKDKDTAVFEEKTTLHIEIDSRAS